MTAPAPSPAEQAVIDRFEIFEPEARVVEEVARAIFAAANPIMESFPDYWERVSGGEATRDRYRNEAAAAVAAYRSAQDGDLHTRMADVADNLDYYAGKTDGGTYAGGLTDAAGQIRDALTAAQDGGTCGDLSPSINFGGDSDAERLMCELPVGHGGAHQHDNGDGLPPTRWIAAQDGGAEEAVRRVEALAAEYERTPPGTVTRDRDVALDLRAALAPQAGDGAR